MTKNLTYNITREDAAELMGVSTRTLDRKIAKGIFSYKKIGNRIYLSNEEVENYKDNSETVHLGSPQSVVISENSALSNIDKDLAQIGEIKELISNNFNKFLSFLKEKDAQIQEKNTIIFSMQAKVMELETQLKAFKSLPDYSKQNKELNDQNQKLQTQLKLSVPLTVYNQEKQQLIAEQNRLHDTMSQKETEFVQEKQGLLMNKEKKDLENEQLKIIIRKEKLKNMFFVLMIIAIVLVLFFVFVTR